MTTTNRLSIADEQGVVSVSDISGNGKFAKPEKYCHVRGKGLEQLCRKLGIRYAIAFLGWYGPPLNKKAHIDGVVVTTKSKPKLLAAMKERKQARRNHYAKNKISKIVSNPKLIKNLSV